MSTYGDNRYEPTGRLEPINWKARAEAAETRVTEILQTMEDTHEANADESDRLKARAEAAEEQLRHFGELHRAEWQSQVDRAEAAEKRIKELYAYIATLEDRPLGFAEDKHGKLLP